VGGTRRTRRAPGGREPACAPGHPPSASGQGGSVAASPPLADSKRTSPCTGSAAHVALSLREHRGRPRRAPPRRERREPVADRGRTGAAAAPVGRPRPSVPAGRRHTVPQAHPAPAGAAAPAARAVGPRGAAGGRDASGRSARAAPDWPASHKAGAGGSRWGAQAAASAGDPRPRRGASSAGGFPARHLSTGTSPAPRHTRAGDES
jgi:hypothetical protein